MSSGNPGLLEQLQITDNPRDYFWVSQGVITVDNMDDKQEYEFTDVSFYCFLFSLCFLQLRLGLFQDHLT